MDDTRKFRPGQRIRVFLNDKSTENTRRRRLAAAAPAAASFATVPGTYRLDGNLTVVTTQPPAWVQRHPVYRMALQGAHLLDEDESEYLTPRQAAAADLAAAEANAGAGGGIDAGASAGRGTLVAWLYGQNRVDSGPDSNVVDHDEIAVSAM